MAKRSDFQQMVAAKRKYSVLEIAGNIIIWAAPIGMMLFILIYNWNKLWSQSWGFHLELWMSITMLVMCFVYLKWGRIKIHEKYVADNARAEKHHPLLVFFNAVLNLTPYILGILAVDVLNSLGEPIRIFLIVLLSLEAAGRILLFIDSFKEEEYK